MSSPSKKMLLPLALIALVTVATASVSPATVSDIHGNTADADSKITWVDFTDRYAYNKYEPYDDGGLAPLFNLARSLINTVLPGDLPYDLIKGIVQGTFDIGKNWSELVSKNFMGIAVLLVFGILFVFLFPLVGWCFCCCRCCNNCGGKKKQDYSKYFLHKRVIFAVFLSLCAVFILVGAICVLVTSGQIPKAVKQTDKSALKSMQDADTYLNNTVREITYLAKDGYNFTKNVIFRDLDNIAVLVGVPVRDQLATGGGINTAIQSLITFDTSIAHVVSLMETLNTSYNALVTSSNELYYQVNAAKVHLETNLQNCPPANATTGQPANCGIDSTTLKPTFNESDLPDFSSEMAMVNNVKGQNISALALSAKAVFDDIPGKVHSESLATITSMKPLLTDVGTTIDTALDNVRRMANLSVASYSQEVSKYTDVYLQYDDFRNYGTIGLSVVILSMILMVVLGLFFGILCSSYKQLPWERGTPSTCGGNCLMASVGFMFIFGPLLMLVTTLLFVPGTALEKFACVPLKDPTFKLYKELLDGPSFSLIGPGYPLGGLIFQNNTINLTFSGILQGCKDDKPAYDVFALSSLFDVSQLLDYKQTIDINKELDKINVNLSSIKLMTPEIETQFNSLENSLTLNQTQIKEQMSLNLTTNDLLTFAALLNSTADSYKNISASASAALQNSADEVAALQTVYAAQVNKDKEALLNATDALFAEIPVFQNKSNTVKTNLLNTQTYLHVNGTADIKAQVQTYANRVLGVADTFAARALKVLNNDLGKCGQVWTVYEELTSKILCSYLIDVLNGFWISLGWCLFFFTPSIIFSVKLAKHYRCMKYKGEGFDEKERDTEMMNSDGSWNQMGSNKIAPGDNAW